MRVLDTRYDETDRTEDLTTVVVDDDQRRRSRFRTTTEDGETVGVVPGDGEPLATGDVLGTESEPVAVVELSARTAAVLDVAAVAPDTGTLLAMAELGHALGNRHRELAVRGSELLVPVTDGRERLEAELRPLLPESVSITYESVDPGLFDDQGGDHGHDDGHGHSHGDDDYAHSHGDPTPSVVPGEDR